MMTVIPATVTQVTITNLPLCMVQVRSICDHVRPDRQTLLFSATFKRKVERLARDVLTDPVRVVQGELGEANQDVTQVQ